MADDCGIETRRTAIPKSTKDGAIPMAKKPKKTPKPVAQRRYRDNVTGRFVSKKYAKKNRDTTQKETLTTPA